MGAEGAWRDVIKDVTPLPEETDHDHGDLDRCEFEGCHLRVARHLYCRLHGEMVQQEADAEFRRLRAALGLNPTQSQQSQKYQQQKSWKQERIERLTMKHDVHREKREKLRRQRPDVAFDTSQKHKKLSEFG